MTEHERLDTAISPEQIKLADRLTEGMAEKFCAPIDQFVQVQVADEESSRLAVVFAAEYALPVDTTIALGRLSLPGLQGSWKSIFRPANQERYLVEADGQQYDTRYGMTFEVYEAMVRGLIKENKTLPDCDKVFDPASATHFQPRTFLTGEALYWDTLEWRAPTAHVSKQHGIRQSSATAYNRHSFIGFRPAVLLNPAQE